MAIKNSYTTWYERPSNVDVVDADDPDQVDFEMVLTEEGYKKSLEAYERTGKKDIAVDTETTGLDHSVVDLVGISWAFERDRAYYLPVGHRIGENAPERLAEQFVEDFMYPTEEEIYFFNARFDMRILRENVGLDPDKFDEFDTSVMLYNMDMNVADWLSLKWVMGDIFDWELEDVDRANLAHEPPEKVLDYAAKDALGTYEIPYQWSDVFKTNMANPIEIDNKITKMVMEMEEEVKQIDKDHYEDMLEGAQQQLEELEQDVYEALGQEINLNSPKQKREAFEEMGIDTGVETDTGKMSTGKEALRNIRDEFPVADKMIKHAEMSKHIGTYIKPFIEEYRESDGGLYFEYNTVKADTGRLSGGSESGSANPFFADINCQGLTKADKVPYRLVEGGPVLGYDYEELDPDKFDSEEELKRATDYKGQDLHLNIRHGIKAPENRYWVSVDYSGQELRMLANESKDPTMVDEFLNGSGDLHTLTLENVLSNYGDDYDRGDAKGLNFAIAYGAKAYRISQQLGITKSEAQEILDTWWNTYPGVKRWVDERHKQAREDGFVTTHFGRVRWLGHLFETGDWFDEKFGERSAQNTPIQGAGADAIKLGSYRVSDHIYKDNKDKMELQMQVHDEQNYTIIQDESFLFPTIESICDEMCFDVPGWEVPMEVDVEIGTSFGQLIPLVQKDDSWYLAGEKKVA